MTTIVIVLLTTLLNAWMVLRWAQLRKQAQGELENAKRILDVAEATLAQSVEAERAVESMLHRVPSTRAQGKP